MTDEKRPESFAERLRRIEQQRDGAEPEPAKVSRPASNFSYNPPKENHTVRNSIIWIFIIALTGAGGYFGFKELPPELSGVLTRLAGAGKDDGSEEKRVDTASVETDTVSYQGATLASPVVVHTDAAMFDLGDIATNVDLTTTNTAIGQIIPFQSNAECDLRNPLPDEQIVNVRVENALLATPVQAFSNELLAQRLLQNVEAVTQRGAAYDLDGRISEQKTSMDVFLTDTSAPIYLVVQNMGPGIIWNVHTAPDVTLAHVAIVSTSISGLVSPPNDATFEALLVSDFVPPHSIGDDDQARSCMIRPWRNPQPEWIGAIEAAGGNSLFGNQISSYTKGYAAYNRWYTATLGVDASTNTVSPRDAAHVLIGPKPAQPIPYRAMAGRDIHLMQTDNMFAGSTAERRKITEELHTNMLLAAIGGDVGALDPDPMERSSQ